MTTAGVDIASDGACLKLNRLAAGVYCTYPHAGWNAGGVTAGIGVVAWIEYFFGSEAQTAAQQRGDGH